MCEIQLTQDIVTGIQEALFRQNLVKGVKTLRDALMNGPIRLSLQSMKQVTENIRDGNTRPVGDRIAVSMESAKEARRALYEQLRKEFKDE